MAGRRASAPEANERLSQHLVRPWYTSGVVCDPNPGAHQRAVEALLEAYPDKFTPEEAAILVSVVNQAFEADALGLDLKF